MVPDDPMGACDAPAPSPARGAHCVPSVPERNLWVLNGLLASVSGVKTLIRRLEMLDGLPIVFRRSL